MKTTKETLAGRPFFCSWSGGKDSCLALYEAYRTGGRPEFLLTMLKEDGLRSRSHELPRPVLEAQAGSLGLEILFRSATWEQYEAEFLSALHELKKKGIEVGVFGDIDLEEHRQWVERVCATAGVIPIHPLWKRPRRELLEEFIGLGFRARIVGVNSRQLDPRFLGRVVESGLIRELEEEGIDPSGETGEYHTVVLEGPLFSRPVPIFDVGRVYQDEYRFLHVSLSPQTPAVEKDSPSRKET